jgi:hypothetical protein
MSTLTVEDVKFARLRPITTVVVADGAVYTVIAVLAAVLDPSNVLSLKVLAIAYPMFQIFSRVLSTMQ